VDIKKFNDINLTETKLIANNMLKYLIKAGKTYEFKVNSARVKVLFSTQNDAPTLENALVKIASKRIL